MTPSTATAPPRHPRLLIAVHWLTAALLLAVFALVLARELFDEKALRDALLQLHRQLALAVGLLTALRLLGRTRWTLRAAEPASSPWAALLAQAVHALLYALLLVLPLLGWALTNARGHAVSLPALGTLPALVARDPDLADTLEDWHGNAAWLLAAAVALHAGAALWHHWVRRDGVLAAMWPGLRSRG
ncbi:cytochrome b [Azohydromonas lata]|uniref:cytochrome b n=1 Tax=Azohydromonas lata TaxID=45677 RepID=UPI002ACC277F|nr:cytochrome b/b6 domain-containing protein [Azohydromonas lata]